MAAAAQASCSLRTARATSAGARRWRPWRGASRRSTRRPASPAPTSNWSTPDLRTAAAGLIAGGAGAIRVVPLFLGMGKHLREDLPRLLDELRALHPGVAFSLARPSGEEPEVIDLLARMALES